MNKVAKVVIIDANDKYLVMYRNAHPRFGNDPDLPGGTLEEGEVPLITMIREVKEEAGVDIDKSTVKLVYEGTDYSRSGTHYSLFTARVDKQPTITMSWEHSGYKWLNREAFLKLAKGAEDSYMNMVYETLK